MSFGENLQFLRKNEGITQEELAERLEVSRQSVSKWESGAAYPETDKIIQLSEMFGCSVDSMLKGEVKSEVTDDIWGYDKHMSGYAKGASAAIGILLFGVTAGAVLSVFEKNSKLIETLEGIIVLLAVLVCTVIFIIWGIFHEDFQKENPHIGNFYTNKEIKAFNKKYPVAIAIGVGVIILGVIASAAADVIPNVTVKEIIENGSVMAGVTVGTTIMVYFGMLKSKFDVDGYNNEILRKKNKEGRPNKNNTLHGIIWLIASAAVIIFYVCYRYGVLLEKSQFKLAAAIVIIAAVLASSIVALVGGKKDKSDKDTEK